MSLLRGAHFRLTAAGILAVVIPWQLIEVDDGMIGAAFPYLGRVLALPEQVASPDQAMGGRLFFGPIESAAYVDGALATGAATASAPPPPPPTPPTLLGTATSRRGRAVAVLRLVSGETKLAARGETIDGWTITSIGEARVTIRNAGVTQRLELPRSSAGPTPSSRPPAR